MATSENGAFSDLLIKLARVPKAEVDAEESASSGTRAAGKPRSLRRSKARSSPPEPFHSRMLKSHKTKSTDETSMRMLFMRAASFILVAVLVVADVSAQDKPNQKRQWQDGAWGDTERVSVYVGSISNAAATGSGPSVSASGSTIPVRRVTQVFVIETTDRWYVASQRLKWRWSKPVPMTINAPARFAVDRDKLYVLGEDEKEYELQIEKKGLKVTK